MVLYLLQSCETRCRVYKQLQSTQVLGSCERGMTGTEQTLNIIQNLRSIHILERASIRILEL